MLQPDVKISPKENGMIAVVINGCEVQSFETLDEAIAYLNSLIDAINSFLAHQPKPPTP